MRNQSRHISTTIALCVLMLGGAYFIIRNWDETPPRPEEVVIPPEVEEFYEAVKIGKYARAQQMLDRNPRLVEENYPDIGTAIHVAATAGQVKMIELLLSHGAQVDSIGKWGGTPLHWAAYVGHVDAVDCLIKNGANVNARCERYRSSPILWAAHGSAVRGASQKDYTHIARALLERGADPNVRMTGGMPAIVLASREFADVMLQFGAESYGQSRIVPAQDRDSRSEDF